MRMLGHHPDELLPVAFRHPVLRLDDVPASNSRLELVRPGGIVLMGSLRCHNVCRKLAPDFHLSRRAVSCATIGLLPLRQAAATRAPTFRTLCTLCTLCTLVTDNDLTHRDRARRNRHDRGPSRRSDSHLLSPE